MSTAGVASRPAQAFVARFGVLPLALALLLPILAVNSAGFLAPVLQLAVMSLRKAESSGAMLAGALTLGNWSGLVQDAFYLKLLWSTVRVSLAVTLLTLVASYPIALFVHRIQGVWRSVLLVLVIAPFLTSAVVRTYGWIAILSDQGLVNAIAHAAGVAGPLRLIYNEVGVVLGLVEVLMPYMILSLLAGFGRLDPRLEEAAMSLGASPFTAFRRVTFPLSMPGVALGCLLTFVLSVSSFITPKLLGGGRVFLLATEIYDQAIVTLNWPLAATLSIVVLVLFGGALALYSAMAKRLG